MADQINLPQAPRHERTKLKIFLEIEIGGEEEKRQIKQRKSGKKCAKRTEKMKKERSPRRYYANETHSLKWHTNLQSHDEMTTIEKIMRQKIDEKCLHTCVFLHIKSVVLKTHTYTIVFFQHFNHLYTTSYIRILQHCSSSSSFWVHSKICCHLLG